MVVNNAREQVKKLKEQIEQLAGKLTLNSASNGYGFSPSVSEEFILLKEINKVIKELEKELAT